MKAALVLGYRILLGQRHLLTQFIFISVPAVMVFLAPDILIRLAELRMTHAERCVAGLPREMTFLWESFTRAS